MDYKPRFNQPFTLHEAINLDVSTITEEISRLQYSLKRLRETQVLLHEAILGSNSAESADAEVVQAFAENQIVIGSQEERIGILKLALSEKGVSVGAHYDLDSRPPQDTAVVPLPTDTEIGPENSGADGGIHL